MSITAVPPQKQFGPEDVPLDPYDFDAILPLSIIRSHTKTDDIPSVTDELLELYRDAALMAVQEYTGLRLHSREIVFEDVRPPNANDRRFYRRRTFTYTLKHPTMDGRIWHYGKKNQKPRLIEVLPGSTNIEIPRDHDDFGLGCCNPCGPEPFNRIMYVSGFECLSKLGSHTATLKLGALKYIAHVVMNAGDNVVTTNTSGGRSSGTNLDSAAAADPAHASGAVAIWRSMVRNAI